MYSKYRISMYSKYRLVYGSMYSKYRILCIGKDDVIVWHVPWGPPSWMSRDRTPPSWMSRDRGVNVGVPIVLEYTGR